MPFYVVVLLKGTIMIKKQKEKRKTREIKVEMKRHLQPILHQTQMILVSEINPDPLVVTIICRKIFFLVSFLLPPSAIRGIPG